MQSLTYEQVIPWFQGSVSVEENEGELVPFRFTKAQLDEYGRADNFRIRSLCPAGITIDVSTDSAFIAFGFTVKGQARKYLHFDIFVDGVWTGSVDGAELLKTSTESVKRGTFRYELHDGQSVERRRVTIYLPHSAELAFHSFEISAGAAVEPVSPSVRKLLCLGDSITQGMDARHPASTYPALLSRALNAQVVNHGVGGYFFEEASLDTELPYAPDWVTIAYGTNDWGRVKSVDEFRAACGAYIARVTELFPHAQILVMTPFWRQIQDTPKTVGTLSVIRQAIADICEAYPDVTVVDGLSLVPHRPDLFADGTHPTDEGYLHLAMNLRGYLAE